MLFLHHFFPWVASIEVYTKQKRIFVHNHKRCQFVPVEHRVMMTNAACFFFLYPPCSSLHDSESPNVCILRKKKRISLMEYQGKQKKNMKQISVEKKWIWQRVFGWRAETNREILRTENNIFLNFYFNIFYFIIYDWWQFRYTQKKRRQWRDCCWLLLLLQALVYW